MDGSILDTLWVVIAAGFVFLMQPGFMCLESGLTRSKNSINVAVKNLADFVFSVLCFWSFGYGLMFGLSRLGLFGDTHFFVDVANDHNLAAFFLFQAMFCGTATTIFSGAVAERMKFSAYLIIVFILSTIIYPIFGHWAWNGLFTGETLGWLGSQGFVDFAGSTVVHSVGGWVALAAILVIGPRKGRFDSKDSYFGFNGSNLPLSVLGTFLLWFGWIGFNGGSTLAMNESVPRIVAFTILSGAAGAFSNIAVGYFFTKTPRVNYLINGSLGGLVAITAGCHVVGTVDSIIIGLVAGIVCFFSEFLMIKLKIDDAVGAIPVHLACGIWGTLAVALFGNPELLQTGLTLSEQFIAQCKGVFAAFVIAFLLPLFIIKNINKIHPLRVSAEDEHIGLNVSEHGATTELIELFQAMDEQVASSDLTMRMPVEPFTEVGLIAARHNQIMDSLERALAHTDAVVASAKDTIVTFVQESLEIISINPAGKMMFGYDAVPLVEKVCLPDLFDKNEYQRLKKTFFKGQSIETIGVRRCGTSFPMEAVVTTAGVGEGAFYICTLRDITELKQKEYSLKQSELRYREFFENNGTPTVIIAETGFIEMGNHEFLCLTGYENAELENKKRFSDFSPQSEELNAYRKQFLENRSVANEAYESQLLVKDGSVKPALFTVSMIPDTGKTIVAIVDLSNLKEVEDLLTRQRAYFLQLFEASSQAIVALDNERKITSVNRGFEELFGYKEEEVKGQHNREVVVPDHLQEEIESISTAVLNGNMVKKETHRQHKDGRLIPVSVLGFPITINDTLEGIFYIYEDISERKAFEEQLYKQAFLDGLTGIPNRILFMERLERAIERQKRKEDFHFAVFLIDLDRFKWVNDSLGHLAGDTLLIQMAQRFQSCVRSADTVARLGGDEFAILLEDFEKPSRVIDVANRLQDLAQQPFSICGTTVHVSASIGVVLKTRVYGDTEAILRDADIAMYKAKELGKARFQVFNKKLHQSISETLQLENDLRYAIENNQLRLHYQPIIDIKQNKLIGFEALVRWQRSDGEFVYPDTFIPIAEDTGLIIPLGEWVLREACSQLRFWHLSVPNAGFLTVNVNISAKQFVQNDLVSFIKKVLIEECLEPNYLKIELTESAIMEGGKRAIDRLYRLKDVGVKLVIDDFGTGYSSLAALQQFPIDDLKIDRSFICEVEKHSENRAIVNAIISLAKTLDLGLVAEGVETVEQLAVLHEMECNSVQGYFFSKPVSASEIPDLVKRLT